ncbi:hypothetical protein ACVISU_002074 [Bradyrhizobium sp. USDA 4452]
MRHSSCIVANDRLIYRPPDDSERLERTLKLVGASLKLLFESIPATFAGHKTHEPFPTEEDAKWELIAYPK